MSRRVGLLLAAICTLVLTSPAAAQTMDISGQLPPLGVRNFASLTEWHATMNRSVPTALFHQKQPLKEALHRLYDLLQTTDGTDLGILVDVESFKAAHPDDPDVYETPVYVPNGRRTMTVAELLQCFVRQLPRHNASVHVEAVWGYIEITAVAQPNVRLAHPPLDARVDMGGVRGFQDLRWALSIAHDATLCAGHAPFKFVIDHEAFQMVPAVPMWFPPWTGEMTLREFLNSALAQVPGRCATFVTPPGFIGITTHERARAMKRLLEKGVVYDGIPIILDAYRGGLIGGRPKAKEPA